MLYQGTITIPKLTTADEPLVQTLTIAKGIITKFIVKPRFGNANLAHLIILSHEHQIAPSTENMDLHSDGTLIEWEDYYECYQPPFELKLKGWNEDDTHQHKIDVYVAVLPRKAIIVTAIADVFDKFLDKVSSVFGIFFPKEVLIEEVTSA